MDYNYLEEMKKDIKEYINDDVTLSDYETIDDLREELYEKLWTSDRVTGNESGSYTCNTYQAEEYLCHNWDLLADALAEFCCEENPIQQGAEWCDVTIRCYLLLEAISDVLEDMEDELAEIMEID